MTGAPIDILLVEDNAGDVELIREALGDMGVHPVLHVAPDGLEAMTFLRREGRHAAAPRPALILLDLNLPKRDGREVLEDLRQDPHLGSIPLVVLTSSESDVVLVARYGLRADCYVIKPVGYERYLETMRQIMNLWPNMWEASP